MIRTKLRKGRKRSLVWQTINLFVSMTIVFMVLCASNPIRAVAQKDEVKVDPNLLQLANEHPDFLFPVIVQKELKNKDLADIDPEAAVEEVNGKVNHEKKMDFIASFSAELAGKEIEKLAKNPKVRWISLDAPLYSTATPQFNILDEFASESYSGNNGSVNWAGNWIEVGETTGTDPTRGRIEVKYDHKCNNGGGYCLQIDPDPYLPGISIYRQIDLSNVALATLSLYRTNELNSSVYGFAGTNEKVNLQISSDSGTTWTTLRAYSSSQFTGSATDSFNITAYASGNTVIRFLVTSQQFGSRYIYFDSIQIAFTRAGDFRTDVRSNLLTLAGDGVAVAVVDSGINPHADFLASSGSSNVIANATLLLNTSTADGYGHGTHVAGIIGGKGNLDPARKGMAPNAKLINVKVSNDNGMSLGSDLVAGLQWVYDNRLAYNIRVVNISMNSSVAESYQTSPIDAAVEILWFNGIVVVVSAGNAGAGAVYPPANDPFVITVGATDDKGTASIADDVVASFSAYGATEDTFTKPDLVAPGCNIVSLLASTSDSAYLLHPEYRVNGNYFRMSGTSMSAPVVSGAVALLLQDEPNLNPDQVKYRLMATANKVWNGYSAITAGAGYLDVFAAVNGTTTQTANTGILPSQLLNTGSAPISTTSVGWNSVGWNSVGWNSVGWNSVGWNSVGWNSDYWEP